MEPKSLDELAREIRRDLARTIYNAPKIESAKVDDDPDLTPFIVAIAIGGLIGLILSLT